MLEERRQVRSLSRLVQRDAKMETAGISQLTVDGCYDGFLDRSTFSLRGAVSVTDDDSVSANGMSNLLME